MPARRPYINLPKTHAQWIVAAVLLLALLSVLWLTFRVAGSEPARYARVYSASYALPAAPMIGRCRTAGLLAFVPVTPSTGRTVGFTFRIEPGEEPWTAARRWDGWVADTYPGAKRLAIQAEGDNL